MQARFFPIYGPSNGAWRETIVTRVSATLTTRTADATQAQEVTTVKRESTAAKGQ